MRCGVYVGVKVNFGVGCVGDDVVGNMKLCVDGLEFGCFGRECFVIKFCLRFASDLREIRESCLDVDLIVFD